MASWVIENTQVLIRMSNLCSRSSHNAQLVLYNLYIIQVCLKLNGLDKYIDLLPEK